jgi:hypothetical protein
MGYEPLAVLLMSWQVVRRQVVEALLWFLQLAMFDHDGDRLKLEFSVGHTDPLTQAAGRTPIDATSGERMTDKEWGTCRGAGKEITRLADWRRRASPTHPSRRRGARAPRNARDVALALAANRWRRLQ